MSAHAFHRDGLVTATCGTWRGFLEATTVSRSSPYRVPPRWQMPGAAARLVRRLGGDLRLDVEPDPVHFRQVSDAHSETGPR